MVRSATRSALDRLRSIGWNGNRGVHLANAAVVPNEACSIDEGRPGALTGSTGGSAIARTAFSHARMLAEADYGLFSTTDDGSPLVRLPTSWRLPTTELSVETT